LFYHYQNVIIRSYLESSLSTKLFHHIRAYIRASTLRQTPVDLLSLSYFRRFPFSLLEKHFGFCHL